MARFELFWVRFWHTKYVFPEKKQKVNGGQKSHTGSPGVDRYADYNGPTSNPNGRLVFELLPNNRFLTPNWPFMSMDHLPVLFEKIPLPHSLLVPKYQMCQTLSLEVIAFWIFFNYWPYLTLGNLCGQKNLYNPCAHLRPMGYQCTPMWQLYHVQALEEMRLQKTSHTHRYILAVNRGYHCLPLLY